MNWFSRVSFKARILLIVSLAIFICSAIAISGFLYFNKQEMHRGVIEKSRAIHLRLEAATHFVATQAGLPPIIDRMKLKYKPGETMSDEDKEAVLKQVPIVAAMKIGAKDADKDNYEFRIFSDEPRKEINKADSKEMVVFNKFLNNEALTEYIDDNDSFITVYRPVRLKKDHGCMTCHGDPQTSPWNNGKDVLGYKMENWPDNKLHGVFAVKTDVKKMMALEASDNQISPSTILVLAIILGGALGIAIAAYIIRRPISTLNDIVKSLDNSGNQVNGTSVQIASTSEELAQASHEQASSIQETSSAIDEISAMINSNADNAMKSSTSSQDSLNIAEKGKEVIGQMIIAIEDINVSNDEIMHQIDSMNNEIKNIVTIIQDIGAKTNVINDIVFQTKLLSFNASVEAARAGESGKGFAVVAEEVGNLAAMSGKAALEISQMLDKSVKTVEEIVVHSKSSIEQLVQQGKVKVETGTKIARESEIVLNEIAASIQNVSKMIAEISSASQEQAAGVNEITKAIGLLDQVNQQNSSTSAQSANAATELATQAAQLNDLVKRLVVIIEGSPS